MRSCSYSDDVGAEAEPETEIGAGAGAGVGFAVFEKMVGEWEDSVRYVHATMEETPRVHLTGTTRVRRTTVR